MHVRQLGGSVPRVLGAWCCAIAAWTGAPAAAELTGDWTFSPYKVLLTVAVDDSLGPDATLRNRLQRAVGERVQSRLAPLWAVDLRLAKDAASRKFCLEPDEPWAKLPDEYLAPDKAIWFGLRVAPGGFVLTCREFDVHTRQWGAVQRRSVAQRALLDEACFTTLCQAFAPLAMITVVDGKPSQVALSFKGSALPRRDTAAVLVRPGDAYLPLLRRLGRGGAVDEKSVTQVPWTYLTLSEPTDAGWIADVVSGTRTPFGVVRPRVEQIALALRNPPGPTRVRFHARTDQKQGLAGYEVFRQTNDGGSERVGVTDGDGVIEVPALAENGVVTLLLRSEGQLLAKAPAPIGAALVEIPIADNPSRLRAAGEAQVIREQLVDVVARRTIMSARIRALLKEDRVDDARKLMAELDALPTAATFTRSIDAAAKKLPPVNDPSVQRMIDGLFSSTRAMLGKFLDRRPIIELQSEVNSARSGGS